MSLHHSGKGIAFGRTAELEDTFDVNYESRFRKPAKMDNLLTAFGGIDENVRYNDSIDCDTIDTNCVIYVGENALNKPEASGWLITRIYEDYKHQEYVSYTGRKYERLYKDNAWQEWIRENGDFIISYGQSGMWYFFKWYSGLAWCWGHYKWDVNATFNKASWANGWEPAEGSFYFPQYPFKFVTSPAVSFSLVNCDSQDWSGDIILIQSFANAPGKVRDQLYMPPAIKFWRGTQKTLGHPQLMCQAIGWWREVKYI